MDFTKAFLYSLLAAVIFMLWTTWVKEHPTIQPTNIPVPSTTTAGNNQGSIDNIIKQSDPLTVSDKLVTVKTDVMEAKIDLKNGNLVGLNLLNYSSSLNSHTPFSLLDYQEPKRYIATSDLQENDSSVNSSTSYQTAETHYALVPGKDTVVIDLTKKTANGITITKRYIFKRNHYEVEVSYLLKNQSAQPWKGSLVLQLLRPASEKKHLGLFGISSYEEAAISSAHKPYEKITYKEMQKNNLDRTVDSGWIAMQEHYFLGAWIPTSQHAYHFFTRILEDNRYLIGAKGPEVKVLPGQSAELKAKAYFGPEVVELLKTVAPHLELTIDYGWLWFISEAIFWVMKQIHKIVGNWGWSIILVTLTIKLLFYRLSAASYRSMSQLRKLQPRLESIRERFKDDRQRMNQAILEFYRKERINPFGGCLPILIQIPVFIALYWVLLESVELRHAPFMGWIHDLSARDPYFVLPVLMGLSMFVQQRLSPAPPDPIQAKVMMALPVFFTFLFLYFPSGLVLYWVVNNILSIAQQWYIMRKVNGAPAQNLRAHRAKKKMA